MHVDEQYVTRKIVLAVQIFVIKHKTSMTVFTIPYVNASVIEFRFTGMGNENDRRSTNNVIFLTTEFLKHHVSIFEES